MKKTFLAATLLSICLAAGAQNEAKNLAGNCYRGYVDLGYSIGVGDYQFGRVEVNTSHGYQFNPHLFLGAGLGMHFMLSYQTESFLGYPLDKRDSSVDVPIFGNVRWNFTKTRFSPFVDAKAGGFVTNHGGVYFNISAGCRMAIGQKQGITLAVGYGGERLQFQSFSVGHEPYDYYYSPRKLDAETVTVKAGFEF